MIFSVGAEIRLHGVPSTIVQVRLSLKHTATGDGRFERVEAKTFLEEIIRVYEEERTLDASLPELPDREHLALARGDTELEASDDVSMTFSVYGCDSRGMAWAVVDKRERKVEQVRKCDEAQNEIVAGGVGKDDHYAVVLLPASHDKVLCLRPNSALTEFIRSHLMQNDERLFQQQKQHRTIQHYGNARETASSRGIDEFSIRVRFSEFAPHSHKIIGIVARNHKDGGGPSIGVDWGVAMITHQHIAEYDDSFIVLHELGHCLYLSHAAEIRGHDPEDKNCAMWYPEQDPKSLDVDWGLRNSAHANVPMFCGKCVLKLRGWRIEDSITPQLPASS